MSSAISLDIRVPIGALFTALGLVVAGYGLATAGDAALYARSGNLNVNLWWGLVMLVFGIAMLLMSRRSARRPAGSLTAASVEGRATEAREKAKGLER